MKPQGTSEKEPNGTPGNENVFVEIRKKKLSSVLSIIVDSAEETSELEAKSEDITQEAARRIKGARKYQLRDMEERTVRTRRRKQNGEEAIFEKMTEFPQFLENVNSQIQEVQYIPNTYLKQVHGQT